MKLNAAYYLKFYDHSLDGNSDDELPLVCEVLGFLLKETKRYVRVSYWEVSNADPKTRQKNRETITILKSTLIQTSRISIPKREHRPL